MYTLAHTHTHTLVQLCLCRSCILYQWIDPITHQWTGKKRAKKDSMDDDDERYSLPDVYIHTAFFLFDSTFISFSSYSLSFWTNRQAMKKRRHGFRYLFNMSTYNTYTHIDSIIRNKTSTMRMRYYDHHLVWIRMKRNSTLKVSLRLLYENMCPFAFFFSS